MVTIQGFHSSVIESWIEDGEAGGHFFLLLSVSYKAFTEQQSKLSPEGEEGLSLYHEPIIVADMQGRYIDLTTDANVTFPLHFIWELACQIGSHVDIELDTGHFLSLQRSLRNESSPWP